MKDAFCLLLVFAVAGFFFFCFIFFVYLFVVITEKLDLRSVICGLYEFSYPGDSSSTYYPLKSLANVLGTNSQVFLVHNQLMRCS